MGSGTLSSLTDLAAVNVSSRHIISCQRNWARSPSGQSPFNHFQGQEFARLAFNRQFKWPAADLAIRRESLRGGARINHEGKLLTAIRALDGFADFHRLFALTFLPVCA